MTPDSARNFLLTRFAEQAPYGALLVDWSMPFGTLYRNVAVQDEFGREPEMPLWGRIKIVHSRRERHGFPGRSARVHGVVETRILSVAGEGQCCFADCLITDFSDYFVRWVRGFPTVFRDRRKMGRLAECRTGVGASSGCAAPALRCGPSGDPPPCARLSASMAVSAAFGHGPIARRSVLAGT